MRYISQFIANRRTKWTSIAISLITKELKKLGPSQKRKETLEDCSFFLLDSEIHNPNFLTYEGMLRGWTAATKELQFNFAEKALPILSMIDQLLMLYKRINLPSEGIMKALRIFMENRGIKYFSNLQT